MEVVVTTGARSRGKLQSNYHHQQTVTQLFTGLMPCPSCLPTNSVKAPRGKFTSKLTMRTTTEFLELEDNTFCIVAEFRHY